jgi:hypothetical protein
VNHDHSKVFVRALTVAFFFGSIYFVYYGFSTRTNAGFFGWSLDWVSYLAITFLMLLGILFGTCYRLIGDDESTVNVGKLIGGALSSPSFWKAMFVAPIVLGGVYVAVGHAPAELGSYLLAFLGFSAKPSSNGPEFRAGNLEQALARPAELYCV